MQSNPRISANLPVILVKILVNLLVKLTKLGQGAMGGGVYSPPPPLGLVGNPKLGSQRPIGLVGNPRATPDGPPNTRGVLLVILLPTFTDFSDFLGRIWITTLARLLFYVTTVFFSGIVLRRNQTIKEVALVEASSILPLPRRLESYQDKLSQLDVFEQ